MSLYRIHDFARLAGVTVRALHHYDRLALLKPKSRTEGGYRLYDNRDLLRLEQIVLLKFLGLPLKQIRALLFTEHALGDTLHRQRQLLEEKRSQLDKAIMAIEEAERCLKKTTVPDWDLIKNIVREIEMQNDIEWAKKYYSEDAQKKVEQRKALWSPQLQEQVTRDWNKLFADVEASLHEDPTGPKGQELAARWRKLLEGFTGGDAEIQRGLNAMYQDQANWPATQKSRWQIKPEVQEFIRKAMAPGKRPDK